PPRHTEQLDRLTLGRAEMAAGGDEGQVHRVQHDLDRQQDRDQVAAQEHADRADGEQDPREDQEMVQRHWCFLPAITTAPTIETRIRIEVTSNANACVVNSDRPMLVTELTSVTSP